MTRIKEVKNLIVKNLIVKNFNHYYDRKQGRLSQIVAEIFNTFVAFNHCYSYRRGAIFIGGQTDKDVHRL